MLTWQRYPGKAVQLRLEHYTDLSSNMVQFLFLRLGRT